MSKSAFRCLVNKSFLPKSFHLPSVLAVSTITDVYPLTAVFPQQLVEVKVLLNQFEDASVGVVVYDCHLFAILYNLFHLLNVGCLSCLVL